MNELLLGYIYWRRCGNFGLQLNATREGHIIQLTALFSRSLNHRIQRILYKLHLTCKNEAIFILLKHLVFPVHQRSFITHSIAFIISSLYTGDVHKVGFPLVPQIVNHLLLEATAYIDRIMTSYDACTSRTSRVLVVASLQRLTMEALIPAPALTVKCDLR